MTYMITTILLTLLAATPPKPYNVNDCKSCLAFKQVRLEQRVYGGGVLRDVLVKFQARCKNGKLVAKNGRPIVLRVVPHWGNPPMEPFRSQVMRRFFKESGNLRIKGNYVIELISDVKVQ
jgi:hypothetical protein